MPKKLAHTWVAHTDEIRFPESGNKKGGGFCGVELIINIENAEKLTRDLKSCIATAKENKKDRVELHARWGKRMGKGYALYLKVHI